MFNPRVKIPWRRKWQPTLVFWPGEFHGQRSLVGSSPWGRKESDTTERLTLSLSLNSNTVLQLGFTVPRWENGLRFPMFRHS